VWVLYQPHGLRSQKTAFFIYTNIYHCRIHRTQSGTVMQILSNFGLYIIDSRNSGRMNNFLVSTYSRSAPGVLALSPGINSRGTKVIFHFQSRPFQESVDLYIHSSIRLHGIVFN
jgi:hypothetical protein